MGAVSGNEVEQETWEVHVVTAELGLDVVKPKAMFGEITPRLSAMRALSAGPHSPARASP